MSTCFNYLHIHWGFFFQFPSCYIWFYLAICNVCVLTGRKRFMFHRRKSTMLILVSSCTKNKKWPLPGLTSPLIDFPFRHGLFQLKLVSAISKFLEDYLFHDNPAEIRAAKTYFFEICMNFCMKLKKTQDWLQRYR